MKKKISFVCLLFIGSSFALLAQQAQFQDYSSDAGINAKGKNAGVAFGDYDDDGDEDLYISSLDGANQLYQNNGNGIFTNVTAEAGVAYENPTMTSIWGDIDNDGDLDLYLGNYGHANVLYLNNGNGTFTDISESARIDDRGKPHSVMFGDIDLDGDLDLYVANLQSQNVMYQNNGDLTFSDATFTSKTTDLKLAMGGVFFDYDNDRDLDLYLTHDANQQFILYENDGTGTFKNVAPQAGANFIAQGMGVDVGDLDGNGFLDLAITNLYENILALNNGDGTFTEISEQAGFTDRGMGWGVGFLDYDNDGRQDIYIANDFLFSPAVNVLYRNTRSFPLTKVSPGTPLTSPYGAYGLACADVNNDGKVDIAVANTFDGGNQLFINEESDENNWIKIKCVGTKNNRSGIGTRLSVWTGGIRQIDEVLAGSGFAGQNSLIQHFGLGNSQWVDSLIISWPGGFEEKYYDLPSNASYIATEYQGIDRSIRPHYQNASIIVKSFSPNPFEHKTTIKIEVLKSCPVRIEIYDLQGRTIQSVANTSLEVGEYQWIWEGTNQFGGIVPHGVYLLRIQTDSGTSVDKILKRTD